MGAASPIPVARPASAARSAYLRDCWYVAGWAADLADQPWQRTFLDEPVALFRDSAGTARAVTGRCPHRFAALGHGRLSDQGLACPYHGLVFDGQGRCVHNPHQDGALPAARLRTYPLAERHGLLWIWMGQPDRADLATIPDFGWLVDPRWEAVRGYALAEGHYELYSDNILDLSHANFVHPALVASAFTQGERHFWQENGRVHAAYVRLNDCLSDGIGAMLGRQGVPQDFHGEVVWQAPAVLYFAYYAGPPGTPREACTLLPSLHAFTPETADSTHYVWATARDFRLGDAAFSATMRGALEYAFEHEDMPVIRDCHRLMAGRDFWDLQPLVLNGDGGGVRARRMLQRLIASEQARSGRDTREGNTDGHA